MEACRLVMGAGLHVDGDGGDTLRDTTRVGSRLVCGIVLVCW